MQHLVVLEVVQQRIGHAAGLGRQENRRAFNPRWRADEDRGQKARQVNRVAAQFFIEDLPALFPGDHQGEDHAANDQRKPAASEKLHHVGGEKREVDDKKHAGRGNAKAQRVFPAVANHKKGQYGGDQHVSADGDAVSRRQVARRTEHHNRQHDGDKQAPVDKRNIDLPGVAHASVLNVQARQVAHLNGLLGHAEGARDQRLRGNHRGHGGQPDKRHKCPVRRHQVKRVFNCRRVA